MKFEPRHCLILIIIMALCLVGGAKLNASRQSVEYKILTIQHESTDHYTNEERAITEKKLNQHGAEGWEVVLKESDGIYLLKRAK